MYQIWDDPKTLQFFAKFVNIHKSLKDYKLKLMKENEETGVAPLRSLLVEFEDDPKVKTIKDQFMLGSDLMMAPIYHAHRRMRDFYMPQGNWTHLFTNKTWDYSSGGAWQSNKWAPLGKPLVFVKGELRDQLMQKHPEEAAQNQFIE